jgi:hypothetical protein
METGKANTSKNDIIDKLQIGNKLVNNYKKTADILNKHFTSVVETIAVNNNLNTSSTNNMYKTMPTHYLLQSFKCTFPNFKFKSLSTKDIRNIIKSLNTKNSHGYDKISTKTAKT